MRYDVVAEPTVAAQESRARSSGGVMAGSEEVRRSEVCGGVYAHCQRTRMVVRIRAAVVDNMPRLARGVVLLMRS